MRKLKLGVSSKLPIIGAMNAVGLRMIVRNHLRISGKNFGIIFLAQTLLKVFYDATKKSQAAVLVQIRI